MFSLSAASHCIRTRSVLRSLFVVGMASPQERIDFMHQWRSFHPLLPEPTDEERRLKKPAKFQKHLRKSGVIKLAFLRSGSAYPLKRKLDYRQLFNGKKNRMVIRDAESIDKDRKLTQEGIRQVKLASKAFGTKLIPYFDVALLSTAHRSIQTTRLFLKKAGIVESLYDNIPEAKEGRLVWQRPMPDLYHKMIVDIAYETNMPGLIVEGHEEFERLGDRPLIEYLVRQFPNQKMNIIRKILSDYAYEALERIDHICWYESSEEWGKKYKGTFLLVTHKVYLQASALAAACYTDCPEETKNFILNARVRPGEGILLDLETRTAELLSRPDTGKERLRARKAASADANPEVLPVKKKRKKKQRALDQKKFQKSSTVSKRLKKYMTRRKRKKPMTDKDFIKQLRMQSLGPEITGLF